MLTSPVFARLSSGGHRFPCWNHGFSAGASCLPTWSDGGVERSHVILPFPLSSGQFLREKSRTWGKKHGDFTGFTKNWKFPKIGPTKIPNHPTFSRDVSIEANWSHEKLGYPQFRNPQLDVHQDTLMDDQPPLAQLTVFGRTKIPSKAKYWSNIYHNPNSFLGFEKQIWKIIFIDFFGGWTVEQQMFIDFMPQNWSPN